MLIALLVGSLSIGRYGIPIEHLGTLIWQYINGTVTNENKSAATVLFIIRIPRILLSVLVGAALSVSGAAYQGLFKNPMVSPDILGVTGGASTGAALGLLLSFSSLGVHMVSFLFGISAVMLVMLLTHVIGHGNEKLLIMVLCGTVISSIFSSFTALIKYFADTDDKLPAIVFWLMGSFARSGSYNNVLVMLISALVGIVPLMMLRWQINALTFGEEEAQSLGINTKKIRIIIILCATLLTASSVCLCGTIGWVGLIMPHVTRLIVGPNYRALLPTAILSGAVFMLIVDNVARMIISSEIPIGILTSLIGAPLFIYLLFKGRRDWA
jgi:iron complex transport system permease protein